MLVMWSNCFIKLFMSYGYEIKVEKHFAELEVLGQEANSS